MSVFVLHNNMHAIFSFESQTLNYSHLNLVLCDGWTDCFFFINYSRTLSWSSDFVINLYDYRSKLRTPIGPITNINRIACDKLTLTL